MFEELITSLEEVTASLLQRSRAHDCACDLEAPLRQREALIGRLGAELRAGRFVSEAESERLSRVHSEGEHIKANLLEARARVAGQIYLCALEQMLADRIASQIPDACGPKAKD